MIKLTGLKSDMFFLLMSFFWPIGCIQYYYIISYYQDKKFILNYLKTKTSCRNNKHERIFIFWLYKNMFNTYNFWQSTSEYSHTRKINSLAQISFSSNFECNNDTIFSSIDKFRNVNLRRNLLNFYSLHWI